MRENKGRGDLKQHAGGHAPVPEEAELRHNSDDEREPQQRCGGSLFEMNRAAMGEQVSGAHRRENSASSFGVA